LSGVKRTRTETNRPAPADPAAVARCCHALSDETRLAVLECLRGGEECVCNLTGALDTAQSRLSFHLKVLKDAGLVRDRRDGRWIHYSIDPRGLETIRAFIDTLDPRRRKP
jgi:ArsR family transcriptional regulator